MDGKGIWTGNWKYIQDPSSEKKNQTKSCI